MFTIQFESASPERGTWRRGMVDGHMLQPGVGRGLDELLKDK